MTHCLEVLVLGHPRGGTAYCARLLTTMGLDVGHENIGRHGTSCWLFAPPDGVAIFSRPKIRRSDYRFRHVIHVVRNPRDCLASIISTVNKNPWSLKYRRRFVEIGGSELQMAVASYVRWHKLILTQNRIDLTVRVEDCEDALYAYSASCGFPVAHVPNGKLDTRYNTLRGRVTYCDPNAWDPSEVPAELLCELDDFCRVHGYNSPFR